MKRGKGKYKNRRVTLDDQLYKMVKKLKGLKKMANGGSLDPPTKRTHNRIMSEIDNLAASNTSYDDIITSIDDLLQLKDIQQSMEPTFSESSAINVGQKHMPTNNPIVQTMSAPTYKLENGGQLLGLASAGLNLALPGAGSVLGMLGQQMNKGNMETKVLDDHFKSLSEETNPYGNYEHGGKLGGFENMSTFEGMSSHADGGIPVTKDGNIATNNNAIGEIEGDEVIVKIKGQSHVFSKKLKL